MPSSDFATIPKVLSVVMHINPKSILDVGVGNGRYGFLFRECLDLNYGRLLKSVWQVIIDGVEVDYSYISQVHYHTYTNIIVSDWLEYKPELVYDLIFMGDVLEHWPEGQWQQALTLAKEFSKYTLVVAPNWEGSINQGAWCGHDHEEHKVVLSPRKVGGRCLFANSKMFMCLFDNFNSGLLERKDILL